MKNKDVGVYKCPIYGTFCFFLISASTFLIYILFHTLTCVFVYMCTVIASTATLLSHLLHQMPCSIVPKLHLPNKFVRWSLGLGTRLSCICIILEKAL